MECVVEPHATSLIFTLNENWELRKENRSYTN